MLLNQSLETSQLFLQDPVRFLGFFCTKIKQKMHRLEGLSL